MAWYNQNQNIQPQTGGANFNSYYNTLSGIPMQQQSVQPQQSQGSIMTVFVDSEGEALNYPVAAGIAVLLISFKDQKFWIKKTSVNGIPEPTRTFPFTEEAPQQVMPEGGVSREEFDSLSKKIDKLISDLGGNSNG